MVVVVVVVAARVARFCGGRSKGAIVSGCQYRSLRWTLGGCVTIIILAITIDVDVGTRVGGITQRLAVCCFWLVFYRS